MSRVDNRSTTLSPQNNNRSGKLVSQMDNGALDMFLRTDNGKQSNYGRKDRPICSHCGFKGHTEEVYKLCVVDISQKRDCQVYLY